MTGVRMLVRSLTGMQKEALVSVAGAPAWRMVSDEGPYLNGTDLAPFPLAFFTAGMQFSLLSELLTAARAADVRLRSVTIDCDNRYSMEGSFLRGDAIGGAMPADIAVRLDGDLDATQGQRLIATAERGCPAQGLIRAALSNRFALRLDGRPIELAELSACDPVTPTLFEEVFAVAAPQPGDPAIIKKLRAAEAIAGRRGRRRKQPSGRTETDPARTRPRALAWRLSSRDEDSAPAPDRQHLPFRQRRIHRARR